METLADLVAAGRNRDGAFLDIPGRQTAYSHREFCTNVWKAASLLGQYGAHPGGEVAVAVGPKAPPAVEPAGTGHAAEGTAADRGAGRIDAADPLLAILGGTLRGAMVSTTPTSPVAARVLVCPTAWREDLETTAACSKLVYGATAGESHDGDGSTSAPDFDRERWSESPVEPPERVTGGLAAIRGSEAVFSHADLLAAAAAAIDRYGIDDASRVGVRADLRRPGVLAAGVLAPLRAGATVVPVDPTGGFGEAGPTVTFEGRSAGGDWAGNAPDARAGEETHPAPTLDALLDESEP